MRKHTPGPWRVGDPAWGDNYVFGRGPDSILICRVENWHRAESSANAHLIAAAPELLAVAEEIAKDTRVDLVDSERRIRLYAAITKARGDL